MSTCLGRFDFQAISGTILGTLLADFWGRKRFVVRRVVPPPSEEGITQKVFRPFTECQGHNPALTVSHVPYSLDSGTPETQNSNPETRNPRSETRNPQGGPARDSPKIRNSARRSSVNPLIAIRNKPLTGILNKSLTGILNKSLAGIVNKPLAGILDEASTGILNKPGIPSNP